MKKPFLIILCLLISTFAYAQDTDAVMAAVEKKLDEFFEAGEAPGVSFCVVLPNGEERTLVRGWANIEKKVKMSPETKMLGGSTGKVFYSVVAMQLIDEGKLTLDEPISSQMSGYDWFERLPNAKKLTVRNLMRHQTGIPRYVFSEDFQAEVLKDADKVWKPEELLAYVFDNKPLFEAGTEFAYSDTNYIVLCMLIEQVTGNTLYEEVQKRVLDKAGLKAVVPQDKRRYKDLAQGYNAANDPFFPGNALDEHGKSRYNLQFEWAGGGLVITTRDLAVLGKKIYEGKMFNPALLPEYFKGVDAGRLGGEWGLGVHIERTPEGTVYGHSGFMPGYVTNMRYYKKDRFSICYQINTSDRSKMSILRQLPILGAIVSEELNK
ncbi:MAG: serine hydrolase domain-containing protein [Roseivirga sp.]